MKNWLKIKKVLDTLDLIVVATDYGYGYRHAWLSDYTLAARKNETDGFEIIGKCFKGLTDQEIQDMTKTLQKIKTSEKGRTVTVKPKIVLEIAFEEIQKSQRYESGFALRFARIVRIREDKGPDDVDSIDKIRKMYKQQSKRKAL